MEKRGLVGKIILIILGVLVLLGLIIGIYFYNFFVFKEVRICVGEGKETDLVCGSNQDCLNFVGFDESAIEGAPEVLRKTFGDVTEKAFYCDEKCFVGEIRGVDFGGNVEELISCEDGESEFLMEIRGKDALAILKWAKNMSEIEISKEVRICVGDWQNTGLSCENRDFCLEFLNASNNGPDGAPEVLGNFFDDVMKETVYCEGQCFVGRTRGIDGAGRFEELDSCKEDEREVLMVLDGESGVEVLDWMKAQSE